MNNIPNGFEFSVSLYDSFFLFQETFDTSCQGVIVDSFDRDGVGCTLVKGCSFLTIESQYAFLGKC